MEIDWYEANANWYKEIENEIKIEQRPSENKTPQSNCKYPCTPPESSGGPINSLYQIPKMKERKNSL